MADSIRILHIDDGPDFASLTADFLERECGYFDVETETHATKGMELIRSKDLECPDEIRQRARALAEQAEERGVTTGVHPAGFAAACLYKAGREEGRWLTQSEAADVANVTTTTIRNHHDVLQQFDIVQRADRSTVAVQERFIKQ